MKIQFNYRHVDVSSSLNEYADQQFRALEKHLPTESRWTVTFSMGRYDYRVEVSVHAPWGHFKASSAGQDFYSAVDEAAQKIGKQFKKQKEQHQHHKKPELSRRGKMEHMTESLEYLPPWARLKESA